MRGGRVRMGAVGLCAGLALSVAASQRARATLITAYKFDEGSGQTVLDSSGNGYHGFLGSSAADTTKDPQRSADAQGVSGQNGDYALSMPAYSAGPPIVNLDDFAQVPTGGAGQATDAQLAPNQFTFSVDIKPGTLTCAIIAGKHPSGTTGSYFLGFDGTGTGAPPATGLRFVTVTSDGTTKKANNLVVPFSSNTDIAPLLSDGN